ncbi:MAG: hypothetical protein KF819_18945 [Labilithrix sp.]|nr:hypothetical protein [Labilithrix sp.]
MRPRVALSIAAVAVVLASPRVCTAGEDEPPHDPEVHVRFPAGSFLPYIDMSTPGGWLHVCKAPCDRRLPQGLYRVRGRTGISPEPFILPAAQRVRVDAFVGYRSANVAGPLLFGFGVALVGAGTTSLLWPSDAGQGIGDGRVVLGVAGMMAGLVVGGVGLFLWELGKSDVTVTPVAKASPKTSGIAWTGNGFAF